MSALAFQLPDGLEAHEPPEARGGRRDDVRLLVSDTARASIEHARFVDLPRFLTPGDLLVVNTSATLPAALTATRDDGTQIELRLSTPAPGRDDDLWIVELRLGDAPFGGATVGERISLPAGGSAELLARYAGVRLIVARLHLPSPLHAYLADHGRPIRYGYVPASWPLDAYQTEHGKVGTPGVKRKQRVGHLLLVM